MTVIEFQVLSKVNKGGQPRMGNTMLEAITASHLVRSGLLRAVKIMDAFTYQITPEGETLLKRHMIRIFDLPRKITNMFWTKPKPTTPPTMEDDTDKPTAISCDWDKVKDRYPVGSTFSYLGRTMMITKYELVLPLFSKLPVSEAMHLEYADDGGKLHEWLFHSDMSEMILQLYP